MRRADYEVLITRGGQVGAHEGHGEEEEPKAGHGDGRGFAFSSILPLVVVLESSGNLNFFHNFGVLDFVC